MGVGAGLSMYVVVLQKFTFAISSPDEFLFYIVDALSVTQPTVLSTEGMQSAGFNQKNHTLDLDFLDQPTNSWLKV